MTGEIDEAGRALIKLLVGPVEDAVSHELTAWIDTAFDGELVVPAAMIRLLGLSQTAAVCATLADGSDVVLESYHRVVDWFGEFQQVEVISNEGRFPLLGIGLLRARKLTIDYPARSLTLA